MTKRVLTTDDFLTTDEVAERYRVVPGTVRYWRHIGYGPRWIKVGRRVIYPGTEIKRFEDSLKAQTCGSPR